MIDLRPIIYVGICGLHKWLRPKQWKKRTKKAVWRQIRATECIHLTAAQVKLALGISGKKGSLAIVNAPGEGSGEWVDCFSKHSLEMACLAKAGHHFMQAVRTAFLSQPLLAIFGETGWRKPAFDQLLEGMFVPPDKCNTYTERFCRP